MEKLKWIASWFSFRKKKKTPNRPASKSVKSPKEMQLFVDRINEQFPVNALWNGYKIRMFKRRNLVIGGSQDWTYYHNLDVIFKKVIFFNLPEGWHDAAVDGDDLFRLSTPQEFKKHHPDFDIADRHVFAIDLYRDFLDPNELHTFFIIAKNVFLEKFEDPIGNGDVYYEDPLVEGGFLCKKNRVITR